MHSLITASRFPERFSSRSLPRVSNYGFGLANAARPWPAVVLARRVPVERLRDIIGLL